MSVRLDLLSNISVLETLETNVPASTSPIIHHDAFNTTAINLYASSTPPVSLVAAFEHTCTGGDDVINLTSLTGTNNLTIDGTGYGVVACKFKCPSTNDTSMTISESASNGFPLLGIDFEIELFDGQEVLFYGPPVTAVAPSSKNITVNGLAGDVLQMIVVFGAISGS